MAQSSKTVNPTAALFEIDWRKTAVDERSLSAEQVSLGPVILFCALVTEQQAKKMRWTYALRTIADVAPKLGDARFVAQCLKIHENVLLDKLAPSLTRDAFNDELRKVLSTMRRQ
jgi:hypothetical protein